MDKDAAEKVGVRKDDPEHVCSEGRKVPEVVGHGQRPAPPEQPRSTLHRRHLQVELLHGQVGLHLRPL